MTVAFIHGNPETAAIWGPLLDELGRDDAVTLSPPGFGAPVPDGFAAGADDYGTWLVGELEGFDEPVDLVGHDWGGGHVMRAAALRPDLVRSWCTDVAGIVDPDYVWHDLAQVWQTPDEGEAMVAAMASLPIDDRIAGFVDLGMTPEVARSCAELAGTPETGRCILALYRSATKEAMARWGEELEAAERRPSLVIAATEDPYTGGEVMARRTADRMGAEVAVLEGLGHWWMLQDPAAGVAVLRPHLDAAAAT